MTFINADLGYGILKMIAPPRRRDAVSGSSYESPVDKLQTHFGSDVFHRLRNKTVIDFGCGVGREAIEIAKFADAQVLGVELRDDFRAIATVQAAKSGVSQRCRFVRSVDSLADVVISLDSFEHFADPAATLESMAAPLSETGEVWISFGWSWYHPRGGHTFSVFPWAHLVFSEASLIRWRSEFDDDGATRFSEVAGGLNQMTISRFEAIVRASSLRFQEFRLRPIRWLRGIHCRSTREFTTSLIFARLTKRNDCQRKSGRLDDPLTL